MRRAILVLTSLLFVAGTIGTNLGPALVDERPLLTIALSARNRNLFGAVPFVDAVPWAVIGAARLMIAALCLWAVGRWYGERALRWVESQVGELPAIYRWAERLADRAGWLAILLMPGSNVVCLLLGHRRMPFLRFASLAAAGVAVRLVVLWQGGQIFEDEIRSFLNAIERWQWWIVLGLFALTFIQAGRRPPLAPPGDS